MPLSTEPLPPGLEGQGYAAGAVNLRPGLPTIIPTQPMVGALRPNVTIAPVSYSPMDLVARARDRFMNLFQPTREMSTIAPIPMSTAQPLPYADGTLPRYQSAFNLRPMQPVKLAADPRSAELEKGLDALEKRSSGTTVKDLRLANAIANAR